MQPLASRSRLAWCKIAWALIRLNSRGMRSHVSTAPPAGNRISQSSGVGNNHAVFGPLDPLLGNPEPHRVRFGFTVLSSDRAQNRAGLLWAVIDRNRRRIESHSPGVICDRCRCDQ